MVSLRRLGFASAFALGALAGIIGSNVRGPALKAQQRITLQSLQDQVTTMQTQIASLQTGKLDKTGDGSGLTNVDAQRLGGQAASAYVKSSDTFANFVLLNPPAPQTGSININGAATFGSGFLAGAGSTVNGGLQVGTSNAAASAANQGTIRYNPTTNKLEYSNGSVWVSLLP